MGQRKERRETEVTVIACDLCGSEQNMARYDVNRRCHNCEREVCNPCQTISEFATECKVCTELGVEWHPQINAAYAEYERLQEAYKAASLAARRGEKGGVER